MPASRSLKAFVSLKSAASSVCGCSSSIHTSRCAARRYGPSRNECRGWLKSTESTAVSSRCFSPSTFSPPRRGDEQRLCPSGRRRVCLPRNQVASRPRKGTIPPALSASTSTSLLAHGRTLGNEGGVMSRDLPVHANIEHLKKQAKERLTALRRSQLLARLADAQHEVAREYGFASWPKLRTYVGAAHQGDLRFDRFK